MILFIKENIMKNRILSILITGSLLFCAPLWAQDKLTLMLDWFPNVDHLPIYVARDLGYFADQKIELEIIAPSETSDALKLAASGKIGRASCRERVYAIV